MTRKSILQDLLNAKPNHPSSLAYLDAEEHYRETGDVDGLFLMAFHSLRMGAVSAAENYFKGYKAHQKKGYGSFNDASLTSFEALLLRYKGQIAASTKRFQASCVVTDNMSMLNVGFNKLISGKYDEGFSLLENRFAAYGMVNHAAKFSLLQKGETCRQGSLYIIQEGGWGDVLQMARFIPLMAEKHKHIYFHVQDDIYTFMNELLSDIINVRVVNDVYATLIQSRYIERSVSLLSLPYHLNIASKHNPYIIKGLELLRKSKKDRGQNKGLIGLKVIGNPLHETDFTRSLSTQQTEDLLLCLKGLPVVSLEKGGGDLTHIFSLPQHINDNSTWEDTAKKYEELSCVVSVDTSAIHLAGTMSVPAVVMLSPLHEWRWGNREQTSSWYPSVKTFRALEYHSWSEVFDKTKQEVNKHLYLKK